MDPKRFSFYGMILNFIAGIYFVYVSVSSGLNLMSLAGAGLFFLLAFVWYLRYKKQNKE